MSDAWIAGSCSSRRCDEPCSLGRLKAVAAHCRRRGGGCECPSDGVSCKAISLAQGVADRLRDEARRIESQSSELESVINRLNCPIATLRDGFKFRDGFTPVMVCDSDGWLFGYEDASGEWTELEDWPFNEGAVWEDDCKRFGIKIVHA